MGNMALEPIDLIPVGTICWKIFTLYTDKHGYRKYKPWLRNGEYRVTELAGKNVALWRTVNQDGFCCFMTKRDAFMYLLRLPHHNHWFLKQVKVTAGIMDWNASLGTCTAVVRGFELCKDRFIGL